jgi:hypothetical protein
MNKVRPNPFFPQSIKELANALGVYWRELSLAVNSLSCVTCQDGKIKTDGIVINSPDGTVWEITIDDTGTIETNPINDPYWGYVVLLMRMNDNFIDETGNHTFSTQSGTPDFEEGKYANGGLFSSSSINCAASSDFVFSTGIYTFEFWVKFKNLTGTKYFFGTSASNAWMWMYTDGTTLHNYWFGAASSMGTVTLDTWHHVAIVGNGGTIGALDMYLDGVKVVDTANQAAQSGTVSLEIGAAYTASGSATASVVLDEIRITKGIARYTTDFTPPLHPYPNS